MGSWGLRLAVSAMALLARHVVSMAIARCYGMKSSYAILWLYRTQHPAPIDFLI